ncbi:MAG: prenyltransferase/squalene oxidase repeat-containing protein [Planctomycetota bacterium]
MSLRFFCCGFCLAVATSCWGQDEEPKPPVADTTEMASAEALMAPAQAAVDRGLAYLAGVQQEDGSMGVGYGRNVAVVGLTGMAMLASGSTPGRGPYGKNIQRSVDYLLEHTKPSGFITADGSTSQGPMYGHGFATLLLAEAYGMSPRDELRDKLDTAIKLIVSAQNEEGGWRYQPRPNDADISVTICQIMALRAARNAGLHVPNETVDRCLAYVRRCQNPDGGFGYMPRDATSLFPRSAAGVVALYSAGVYEGDEVRRGLAYLEAQAPGGGVLRRRGHYYYGQYYAVQAMWQVGGERWNRWYPAIRDELLASQQPAGNWSDSVGPHYATAMACIILQTPNDLVPIFQR